MWRPVIRRVTVFGVVVGGGFLGRNNFAHAAAAQPREVASFTTSGFIFKDTAKVHALADPKVEGVVLYFSDVDQPTVDKVFNFFSDPSSSSITCVQNGPIKLSNGMHMGPEGEDVYAETRNLLFKQLRIRRIVDKEANMLIYVAYTTRLDTAKDQNKSRFRTSICAIPLGSALTTLEASKR